MTHSASSDFTRLQSLADLADDITSDFTLTERRRRDLLCALRSTARMLNKRPADLPASAKALRPMLAKLHPVQQSITPKRLANIKSDLAAALKKARREDRVAKTAPPPLAEDWRDLLDHLPHRWQAYMLSRFARYCSENSIEPSAVSDTVLADFEQHLDQRDLAKNPKIAVTETRRVWNSSVACADERFQRLTPPSRRDHVCRSLTDYPASFQKDLAAYCDTLVHSDILSDLGPSKPLRPTSVRNIVASVRQFANALVQQGKAVDDVTSLAFLVEPEHCKLGLRYFLNRNGGKPPTWLAGMAGHLLAIARHHVRLSDGKIAKLCELQKRVRCEASGFTDKNRARLAQFEDEENLRRLFDLPQRLLSEARRRPDSSRSASLVLCAAAIEILLVCPIRVANLSSLSVEANFRWSGPPKRRLLALWLPSSTVKNGVAIEADLPRESVQLIQAYLTNWRHLVSDHAGEWLFPADHGSRTPDSLSKTIFEVIHRQTGLEVNAHIFRHLAGMLFLKVLPGHIESVRQLLGHRKTDTTLRFYASMNGKWAVQRYDEVVLAKIRGRQ